MNTFNNTQGKLVRDMIKAFDGRTVVSRKEAMDYEKASNQRLGFLGRTLPRVARGYYDLSMGFKSGVKSVGAVPVKEPKVAKPKVAKVGKTTKQKVVAEASA